MIFEFLYDEKFNLNEIYADHTFNLNQKDSDIISTIGNNKSFCLRYI